MEMKIRLSAIAIAGLSATAVLALFAAGANALSYKPSNLTFAHQTVGTTSTVQQVDVAGNPCGDPMPLPPPGCAIGEPTDIAVSGPFVITSNTCPATGLVSQGLSPFFSCSVGVAFKPTAAGSAAGFLRLSSTPSVVGVPLAGTGCTKVRKRGSKRTKPVCTLKKKKKKKKH
jgi:hypothetical protein